MSSSMSMAMSGMASTTSSAAAAATTSSSMSMDMGMGTGDGAACKISMLWNWTTVDACFLSSSWHITSKGMFAASCIGVAFLVVSLEFLRRLSKEYDAAMIRKFQRNAIAVSLENKPLNASDACSAIPQVASFRWTPLQQLIRAVLHAVTFGVAYIIMLLAMYFNGYIIISIIIGAFIGKFLFDWGEQTVAVGRPGDSKATGDALETTFCCG